MTADKKELLARILREKAKKSPAASLPASRGQASLWFLHRLDPESPAYNVAFAARIRSRADTETLRRSFREILRRHPALRTTYGMEGGALSRRVHAEMEEDFRIVDVSGTGEEDLHLRVRKDYRRPFDPGKGPVARLTLFCDENVPRVLLITAHHLALDGWSLWIVVGELGLLYKAGAEGNSAPLPLLRSQYGDFVSWQEDLIAGPQGERNRAYWERQLPRKPPELELPFDFAGRPSRTLRGDSVGFLLGAPSVSRLLKFARERNTTLYVAVLALYFVLLHRHSGQETVLVGTPMSGRSRPEFEHIVGDFINTVVIRADFASDPSFSDFLGKLRRTVLDAMAHQDHPFALVAESLETDRDSGRPPVFQAAFVMQQPQSRAVADFFAYATKKEPVDFGGLLFEPYPLAHQEGQFDLTLEVVPAGEGLLASLKYDTELFAKETIERMAERFRILLDGAPRDPGGKVSRLPLLAPDERAFALSCKRSGEGPGEDPVRAFEGRDPERTALLCGETSLTYGDLNRRADQIAHRLADAGAGPERTTGLLLGRKADLVAALLGVLKTGGAYLPLDPAYPTAAIEHACRDASVSSFLTESSCLHLLPPDVAKNAIVLDRETPGPHTPFRSEASPGHLAYTIYTSGSTGRPKGVQVTRASLANFLHSMAREPGFSDRDRLLAVTTISFDIAALEILLPLVSGGVLVLADRDTARDPFALADEIARRKITVMQATPSTWRMMLLTDFRVRNFRALCGGEGLPEDLSQRLQERGAELWNMYGPTETTIWSSCGLMRSEGDVHIGDPVADTRLYVLDRNLEPPPPGVKGELYVGGAGLARGYFRRPGLTAERFVPNPHGGRGERLYRTGDLARLRPDGRLEVLGRVDHQIKVRGHRVEPGEIEAALELHAGVREAVVRLHDETLLAAHVVVEAHGPLGL